MKRLRWWRKPTKLSDKADPGRYFAALRNAESHDSFPDVKHWLTNVARDAHPERQQSITPLYTMKTFFITHKRLTLTAVILAITVISCTTPVEHEETVGHAISGIIKADDAASATDALSKLDWIKPDQLDLGLITLDQSITTTSGHRFLIALPNAGESLAKSRAGDLARIEGIQQVNVSPLSVISEKPVYKVLLNNITKKGNNLEFDTERELLSKALNNHLEAIQLHEIELEQQMNASGNMVLSLKAPADMDKSGFGTLKQFIAELHKVDGNQESDQNVRVELEQLVTKLEAQLQQLESGKEREKVQLYYQQIMEKLEALDKVQDR